MIVLSYSEPFDLIAGANKQAVDNFEAMGGNLSKMAENETWFPFIDAFRNSLMGSAF